MDASILKTIKDAAIRTGSDVVKELLDRQLGPTLGGVAGTIIDVVSTSLGVSPEEIPAQDPASVDTAVTSSNQNPEILKLYIDQQKQTNELLTLEMSKSESAWTWAWRPAWMWFLMLVWGCVFIVFPLANASFKAAIPLPDIDAATSLTIAYLGLYLGGHTAKTIWGRG